MSLPVKPTKKAPAGCLIPFGLIFLAAGLAVCWLAWSQFLVKVRLVHTWTVVPCQVTQWEIGIEPANDGYQTTPRVAYNFTWNGQSQTGQTYDLALSSRPEINEFEAEGAKAREGGAVCYVNPLNPAESTFLQASYTVGALVMALGCVFAGVGGLIAVGGVFGLFRRMVGGAGVGNRGAKGCLGGILAPVFFALFAGAGFLVWKLALADQPDWAVIGSRMVPVPAKVVASGVSTSRSSGKNSSTTYKAKIAYQYDFNGRTWHSGWLDFDRGTSSSSNYSKARDAVSRYPQGASTTAWVNPAAPWQAVLEKQAGARWWLWLFPIVFGGIGLLGLLGWLLKVTALGAALFGTRPGGRGH
jgi:hypothetical protein